MNILLADTCEVFRVGFAAIFKKNYPNTHIIHVDNWVSLRNQASQAHFAFIEPLMPNTTLWHESIQDLIDRYPRTSICLLTNYLSQSDLQLAMNMGVKGYLSKTDDVAHIQTSICHLVRGKYFS